MVVRVRLAVLLGLVLLIGAVVRGEDLVPGHTADPNCRKCGGLGLVPRERLKPFVHVEGDGKGTIADRLCGQFCPTCMKEAYDKARADALPDKLKAVREQHAEFEKVLGRLTLVQTRHVAIHTQLPAREARRVGLAMESLAGHLKKKFGTLAAAPTRGSVYNQVILLNKADYLKMIEHLKETDEWFRNYRDLPLLPQLAGSTVRDLTFFHEIPGRSNRHPVHLAVFMGAAHNLDKMSKSRAPAWLRDGFAAFGEFLVLKANRCHSIAYELRDVNLNGNWVVESRRLAAVGQLREWEVLMRLELRDYEPRDYLTAFSTVSFLIDTGPDKFRAFTTAIGNGDVPGEALAQAYGKQLKELEQDYRKWMTGRRR